MNFRIALAATAAVLVVHASCKSQTYRAEIDCSRFSHVGQLDEFTPPAEDDTIDAQTAQSLIIRAAYPKYPDIAVRAGLTGTVWVKLWIGKDGIVQQAFIRESTADIFNEPSLDAARRLVFEPALCQGSPISVWTTLPINFKFTDE